ncbi:class III lanthionine synthetase LanKC [Streptomyces sp. NPDC007084]|uniref:class III lanthionine synthetase LanKC n=1 Tax=Streptomyces sp. NPDC007084 TaxID=3154313 RepID=UPI003452FA9E
MNTHRLLQGFTLADPRFFDDIGRHPPLGDLERQVGALGPVGQTVSKRGPWVSCRPVDVPVPPHGWKIHVSVMAEQAVPVLDILLAEFVRDAFHFKVLRDTSLVLAAASPWWPPGQVGKIAVIYPTGADHCLELLERLHHLLDGFAGPRVLTDRRYRDSKCLFYRYGEFSGQHRTRPDGTSAVVLHGPDGQEWADERLPVYRRPPWVRELLPAPRKGPVSRQIHGYVVTAAVRHSGCGGVYAARHADRPATVLLKESRPRTAFDGDGVDGPARLRREFDTLTRLRDSGVGPEPFDLFEHHEHLFLARENIEAVSLADFAAERSPLTRSSPRDEDLSLYRHQIRTISANLRASVAAVHREGVFHGNLSSSDVLVDPKSLAVRLVGFGSSRPFHEWTGTCPAEPGFRPPPQSTAWDDPRRFDMFGVASAELALITPHGALRDVDPHAVVRSARRAAALLRYPLGDLLAGLELPEDSPEPQNLGLVVEQAVQFIESTLTPDRSDRPFPSSPEMYARSPWPVAHGAAGVARGLHTITGRVHPSLRQWMDAHAAGLDRLPPGLYPGLAGVGWTLLDIGESDQGLDLISRANLAAPGDLPAKVSDGAAGLGLASLAAWHRTGQAEFLEAAARLGTTLVGRASDSGLGLWWPEAGTRTRSFGYAHGSSGVAAFLLYLHFATGDRHFMLAARRALDHDIGRVRLNRSERREPYWERGSAGFGGVVARFCRVTEDPGLRDVLADVTAGAVRKMTPETGLFGGMAGLVNFALDCRDLLNDPQYGELAADLARSLTVLACRQPEGIAFPGRGLLRHSNDFAHGSTGVTLVLDRLHRGGRDFNYTLDELLPVAG